MQKFITPPVSVFTGIAVLVLGAAFIAAHQATQDVTARYTAEAAALDQVLALANAPESPGKAEPSAPAPAAAPTPGATPPAPAADLPTLIAQLQQKIQALQDQVKELQSQLETVKTELRFTRALQRGAAGEEVRELQEFLSQFKDLYPEGLVTGFFGPLTEQAIKRLQEKHGIEPEGIVGPRTRARLNELVSEGAGASGIAPPGLLSAPGAERLGLSTTTPPTPPPSATTTPPAPVPLLPSATSTPPAPPPAAATSTATKLCGRTLNVPSERYPNLQSALDDACRGDVLKLAAGSYAIAVNLAARHSGITITGAGLDQTVIYGAGTGVFRLDGVKDVAIKNVTIERGGGRNMDGGGFWIAGSSNITLESCRVRQSSANQGGAIAINGGSSVSILRCLIDRNVAYHSAGGIIVREKSQVNLANVTIAHNTALGCHGGGLLVDSTSNVTLKNAILWGNTSSQPPGSGCVWGPAIYGQPVVTYSDVQFGYSGVGTIDANPYFVNASGDDFHLASPSSPAVNSGDPATFDPDGSRPDMGVFPYGTALLPPAPTPAPVPIQVPTGVPSAATSTPPVPPPAGVTPPSATTTPPTPVAPPSPSPAGGTPPPTTTASGQTAPLWVRMLGGTDSDRALAVAADSNGNSYIAGYVSASLDGQPYRGGNDAFVAKYDPNGNRVWTRELGSTRSSGGTAFSDAWTAAVVDSSGNVYLAGWSYGSLDGQPFSDNTDAILAKYDTNGTKLWVREFGNTLNDQLYGIAVDATGNVYAAGLTDTSLDGQASAGLMDALLVKYDTNGTKLWTRLLGTSNYDRANAVALDYGVVYVVGWTRGPLGGETYTGNGSEDAFLTVYDPNGTRLWTRLLGGPGSEVAYGVAVGSPHAVYLVGQTSSALAGQSNVGGLDAMAARYEATMQLLQWARQFGSSDQDIAYGAAVGLYLNVYLTGSISGGLDGQANAGGTDAFVVQYDGNGNRVWARLLGTGTSDVSQAVALDGSGNVFIAGGSWGSLGGQSNAGLEDAFLAKYATGAVVVPAPPPPPPPPSATPPAPPPPPPPSTATTSTASINTGTGTAADGWGTIALGTGVMSYSYANKAAGLGYINQYSSNPRLFFGGNPAYYDAVPCTGSGPPNWVYQGPSDICQFTSASNYTFTDAPNAVFFGVKGTSCYKGLLPFKQGNYYGALDFESINSISGALTYRYWYDASGGSNFSSLCTATPPPPPPASTTSTTTSATPPPSPSIPQVQGLTATVSGNSVALSWPDVTGTYSLAGLTSSPSTSLFGSYNIYRGSSADFTPSPIPSNPTNLIVQGSVLSYTDANLPGGTYYYKIALQDKNGVVGPASGAVSAQISAYALTVRGRVVNSITREPVVNSNMYMWNWKGSTRRDFYLQPDGSFAINLTADDIANANAMYVNAVYNNGRACFDQSSFTILKTASGSVDYIHVQEVVSGYPPMTRRVTPVGAEANIGDLLVWPVTGFSLTSDIPVQFSATYENGTGGGGNINYRTSHGFSTLYPVNIGTRITLTDQSGNQYISSYVKYGLSQHCGNVTLNYANGQFSWTPPGTLSRRDSDTSLASILESMNRIRAVLEQLRLHGY